MLLQWREMADFHLLVVERQGTDFGIEFGLPFHLKCFPALKFVILFFAGYKLMGSIVLFLECRGYIRRFR